MTYKNTGDKTGTCQKDGRIDNIPECTAIEQVEFRTPQTAVKKGKVNLMCQTDDTTFSQASEIKFHFVAEDGSLQLISGE